MGNIINVIYTKSSNIYASLSKDDARYKEKIILDTMQYIQFESQKLFIYPLDLKYDMSSDMFSISEINKKSFLKGLIYIARPKKVIFSIHLGIFSSTNANKEMRCTVYDQKIMEITEKEMTRLAKELRINIVITLQDLKHNQP